jgi:hypothetical protein
MASETELQEIQTKTTCIDSFIQLSLSSINTKCCPIGFFEIIKVSFLVEIAYYLRKNTTKICVSWKNKHTYVSGNV